MSRIRVSSSIRFRLLLLVLVQMHAVAVHAVAQPAQPAVAERQVAGVVRHAETRAPLGNVTVSAGAGRTLTDGEGRFVLRVPAGVVTIEVSAAEFYPLSTQIDVTQSDAVDTELLLVPRSGFAETVDVVAPPPPAAEPSAVVVTPAQVLRTPGALDNVFRTLQTLPGVSAAEEFSSRMVVRGGAPDQNLTVMDGVEIHDPYRLFGLTSAFNPETISRFELATGGFSVKYGDRLSSLLVVENRAGVRRARAQRIGRAQHHRRQHHPRRRDAERTDRGWSAPAAPITTSWHQGWRTRSSRGSRTCRQRACGSSPPDAPCRCSGSAAGRMPRSTSTNEDARGEFNDNTNNDLASVRLDAAFGRTGRSHTTVAYSASSSSFGVNAAFENQSQRANSPDEDAFDVANVVFDRTLSVRDVSLRQELGWTRGAHLVEAGGELHRLSTGLSFDITGDRNPNAANGSSQQGGAGLPDSLRSLRDVTRGGLWVLDRWQAAPAMALEAGVRIDRSGVNRDTQVSPRVTATWGLGSRTRLRTALGRYTQSPGYEKLVQSDYVLDLTGDQVGRLRSEQAVQLSAGLERDIAGAATLRIEGYYKTSSRLLVGRLETEAEQQARVAEYDFPDALASSVPTDPIITSTPTNDGSGRAYGFDVFVSRMTAPVAARVRGWASYTWGRATREAYGRTYPFEYDRRHAFSAVGVIPLDHSLGARVDHPSGVGFSEDAAARSSRRERVRRRRPRSGRQRRGASARRRFPRAPDLRRGLRRHRQPECRPPAAVRTRRSAGHVAAARRAGPLGAVRGGHQPLEPPERGRPRAGTRVRPRVRPAKDRRAARSGDPASADGRAPLQLLTAFTPSAGTRASTSRLPAVLQKRAARRLPP